LCGGWGWGGGGVWGGGGGVGLGLRRGGSLVIFFTNWGGSNLFYSQPGEGQFFFGEEKKLLHVA